MLKKVINIKGQTKGYLLGDYFISISLVPYFFKTLPECESIFGIIVNGSLDVSGKVYSCITKCSDLSFLFNSGLDLQDIIFFKCSVYDIELDAVSEIWRVMRGLRQSAHNCYCCLDKNGKELGYILSKDNLFKSKDFYINMLEVLEKGEGYGTSIIHRLLELNKCLEGMAVVSSVEFWESVGAEFGDFLKFTVGG